MEGILVWGGCVVAIIAIASWMFVWIFFRARYSPTLNTNAAREEYQRWHDERKRRWERERLELERALAEEREPAGAP